ncbi:hypothetical protein FALCPG4_000709 [Fusarium falciforme]
MKSISFVLTLLLSSALAAPFESTYSSLSAREEAGLFDDLKGGSLGPRASDDTLVARATADLDKFLASLGGQEKRDGEAPSKREEALLGGLLDGLLGGLTGGSGGIGGAAKGATDTVGSLTGGLTKDLTDKLDGPTGSAGGLTKGLTDKLDGITGGLTGGKSGEDGADKKGSDKKKREEALLGDLLKTLEGLTGGLTGGSGGVGGLTKGLTDTVGGATGGLTKDLTEKLGGVTGSAGSLSKDLTDKLGGLTGGLTGGKSEDGDDKKESDKRKREEAIAGLPISLEDLLGLLGLGKREEALSKREEAVAGLPISIKDLLSVLGLGKRGEESLSKREEAILPISLEDLLGLLGGLSKSGKKTLPKREEAIAGLPISLEDLLGLLGGLGKRDGQELSEREVAGIGRILSLNLLPLGKGSGKREEPKTEELVDPIIAEGSSVERRDPIVLTPEIIKALIQQKLEGAKKGKTDNKGKDKREVASNHEAAANVPTDELKEILKAVLSGAIKLPATDSIKKAVEDKAGDAKDAAQDASGKTKEAVAAVDPVSA